MRILKTEIPANDRWTDVEIGDILHVDTQHYDTVSIWWKEPGLGDQPTRNRRFRIYGTGDPVEAMSDGVDATSPVYIGTAVVPGRLLVWHLFEDVL